MAAPAATASARLPVRTRLAESLGALVPTWSKSAALRAARATVVVPGLFALSSKVIDNAQVATFAAFGAFATLLLASFSGTRLERARAHLALAVVGSVLLAIGTAVHGSALLAALISLPVVFCVLFGGILGPNAASGATAALLAFVLPAASPGALAMVPDRLAGWWLASAAGTVAVLLASPRPAMNQVRSTAAALADALAAVLGEGIAGRLDEVALGTIRPAGEAMLAAFTATPSRATGVALADQALANLVEALQWCASAIADAFAEDPGFRAGSEIDRQLAEVARQVLAQMARLLEGAPVDPALGALERLREESAARLCTSREHDGVSAEEAHRSFHVRVLAAAVRAAATDALIVTGRGERAAIAAEQRRWRGEVAREPERDSGFARAVAFPARLVRSNASLRSVWFLNSTRGAMAIALGVGIAGVTNVEHGFWVVLGALSVLRTNAAATRATALRAVLGTAIGLFVGAGLILAIGSHLPALWVALPVAVAIAAYTPGTAPFAAGQAAFTVMISVLYNLIVPVGWQVGVVRLEDVAIGAGVSAVASALFWPRGASRVVADDLADALHVDGLFLVQATAWALGLRRAAPDAGGLAATAGGRLDDALRVLLTEQGTKKLDKDTLWRLVGGALRLRLTAQSLASIPRPPSDPEPASRDLLAEAVRLAGRCDELATRVGHGVPTVARELAALAFTDTLAPVLGGYAEWVRQHLEHAERDLTRLQAPAAVLAGRVRSPWWR